VIYLIVGFFTGGFVSLVMYSTIVSKRISDLKYQNERLMVELGYIAKRLLIETGEKKDTK
jgi:hypothetical protein